MSFVLFSLQSRFSGHGSGGAIWTETYHVARRDRLYLLKGRVIALCHDMLLFASSIVCLEHRGRFARSPRSGRDRESGAPHGGLLSHVCMFWH